MPPFITPITAQFGYKGLAVIQLCNPEFRLWFLKALINFSEIIISFSESIYHQYNFNPQTRGCIWQ